MAVGLRSLSTLVNPATTTSSGLWSEAMHGRACCWWRLVFAFVASRKFKLGLPGMLQDYINWVNRPATFQIASNVNLRRNFLTSSDVNVRWNELCLLAKDVLESRLIGNSLFHLLETCLNWLLCKCPRRVVRMLQACLAGRLISERINDV